MRGVMETSSEDDDKRSSDGDSESNSDSTGSSSGPDDSSSSESSEGVSDGKNEEDENFEVSFWQSIKAVLPWTKEGKEADYAEERLDAQVEFQEELDQALLIRKMVEMGMHDRALERLMASTEDQMFHDFHKHRHVLEQSGEWSFITPTVRRRWRIATKQTDAVKKLRAYMAMRRDRFLQIRALCGHIRSAHLKSSEPVITIIPNDLVDKNLLVIADSGGQQKSKTGGTFGGGRQKKCHWQNINSQGEGCTCTNYRMEHPHRTFRDEFGVLVHDTLATCGWHASHCVSIVHGDEPVAISTANEEALCNECLAQIVKGPLRNTNAFGAPGVRFKNKKHGGGADSDSGGGGEEFLAWNKWFTKGPGRFRKSALRPRHPHAPPGLPPAGLRAPALFVPPPPPPPFFSMASFRRQQKMAKWRLHKEQMGSSVATAVQKTYRGYRARHEKAMVALEYPAKALKRVESAILMQSLVRRFLARVLVRQIVAFRDMNAATIQRMVRGMQARQFYRRKCATAMVKRQMFFFISKSFLASARVTKRIREEMRKKHAVALSFQRAWRGKKARERVAEIRAVRVQRVGAAIMTQKALRCHLARRELTRRREANAKEHRAATALQSVFRMFVDTRRARSLRKEFEMAVGKLQPMVRGMLARVAAHREKATLDQVWGWLGTEPVTANETYARFLPKNAYEVFRRDENRSQLCHASGVGTGSGEASEKLASGSSPENRGLEVLFGEQHFTGKFDRDRTGTCSKVEFKLGLESFCRSVGYPLQKEEASAIFKRYYDGDAFCKWHAFLSTYQEGNGGNDSCSRHGRLMCALCIRHGQCQKIWCHCMKARAGKFYQTGFKVCECGHPFDAHSVLAVKPGTAHGRALRHDRMLLEKKLNFLLAGKLTVFSTDRPVNVNGCSSASTLISETDLEYRVKTPLLPGNHSSNKKQRLRTSKVGSGILQAENDGDFQQLFSSQLPGTPQTPPPACGDLEKNKSLRALQKITRIPSQSKLPGPEGAILQHKKKRLPTMQEAREENKERRDASWAGRRGQAERAALVEMNSAIQGMNTAEYAVRLHDDIETNAVMVKGSSSLAPVQSKKELRRGFAITDAVPYVKSGVLKHLDEKKRQSEHAQSRRVATVDPVSLYLYLLQAFSNERRELLEDSTRLTDFVARHAVFMERHWSKLIKDIRNGSLDPHLPITVEKRTRAETLMIPNRIRAKKLDNLLRVLGFHARASGRFKTIASATSSKRTCPHRKIEGGGSGGVRGGKSELTQEEKEESISRRVEASRKQKPGTATGGTLGGVGRARSQRKTATVGEMESAARRTKVKAELRPRSPSFGAVRAPPTPEQASKTAYELLTAPSTVAAGVSKAPSGRRVRKYMCLHPGCGRVFHLNSSAMKHQEKEHRFRRKLAASTPLTDQFMSAVWPSDVPWVKITQSQKFDARRKPVSAGSHSHAGVARNITSFHERFTCDVNGCGHEFSAARLLGLHLRMGHSQFDLDKLKAARKGREAGLTPDGKSITGSIDVGRHASARFIGSCRVVPPFKPPSECPAIPACPQHGRLKEGCPRCKEVTQFAAHSGGVLGIAQGTGGGKVAFPGLQDQLPIGLPLPPAKFYTHARMEVRHHGRAQKLDLDCAETIRCPLLSIPRSTTSTNTISLAPRPASSERGATVSAGGAEAFEGGEEETEESGAAIHNLVRDGVDGLKEHDPEAVTAAVAEGRPVGEGEEGWEHTRKYHDISSPQNMSARRSSVGYRKNGHNAPNMSDNIHHNIDHSKNEVSASIQDGSTGISRGSTAKNYPLIPVQLVAVLVDGKEKGWVAARRLWSVRDVGLDNLKAAGLAPGDVDREQEHFVGTAVEYFPLSFVRDTAISPTISRKDDIHTKQRQGSLPKPIRYATHGIDSGTGLVLFEAELKLREAQLLHGGGR